VTPTLDELVVADEPDAWASAGFRVEGDTCDVGTVRLRLAGRDAGRRIVGWSLRGLADGELDGLPTKRSAAPAREPAEPHPNHVTILDHVVAFSPDLDRTVAALTGAGLDLRRVREEPTPAGAPRQGFFRVGEAILEVIQAPEDSPVMKNPDGPAGFWGLAFVVDDIDAAAASFPDGHVSGPRPAVQEGRSIATLRHDAGLALPVALMTPRA
jgi:catechol 2,3-dioxygenase-like lactoylglutathione lyase family enzyme